MTLQMKLENWLCDWIASRGLHPVRLLGKGDNGYAFLLSDGRVLKTTIDEEEADCVGLIVDWALWEDTPHVPEIFGVGTIAPVPWEILEIEDLSDREILVPQFFYIREYLEPVANFNLPRKQFYEQEAEMVLNLELAGIHPVDVSPDNTGYRPNNFTTMVLLDLTCEPIE